MKLMEENKFFRFVWRFDGVLFMIAGVLLIGVLAIAGYKIARDVTRERNTCNIVNVQEGVDLEENWLLGRMMDIQDSPWAMIPLNSDQSYAQSYYSKSSSSARNYLFVNSRTNEKHWLFKTNQYLIAHAIFLPKTGYGPREKPVRVILYQIVKSDTNGDERLTDEDLKTIALSSPDGRDYKEILDGIDMVVGHKLVDENNLFIVFQKNGVGFSANVSLADFKIGHETELPKIGP